MMKYRILTLAAASIVAACASATPYQPTPDGGRWGYQESQIENNRYRVSFQGNSLTDRETVETYLLFRAAELTVSEGFDHFILATRATDTETRVQTIGSDPFDRYGIHYSFYHPRWGWRSRYDPVWHNTQYRESTRFEASAEVLFGRGPKPDDANAYDARSVIENLGDQIVRPEVP